ncbi:MULTISPECIES: hypothetical protein [Helcococcus]|uniref:Uncharacterized protein n=1 Tax=Helcococcus bovis TaxID=3153252 RepID=A0ABW9F7W3_9FIRM
MEITNKKVLYHIKRRQDKRELKSGLEGLAIVILAPLTTIGIAVAMYIGYGLTL